MFEELKAWFARHTDSAVAEVEENASGLLIRCRVTSGALSKWSPLAFFIVWTFLAWRAGGWAWFAFGLFVISSCYWYSRQPVAVDASFSRKGIETNGNFGGGYEPVRQVFWHDVIRLEYSRGTGGEDEDYSPAGLWAICKGFRTCVIPGLDRNQAEVLAGKIYERFHDVTMAVDSGYSGFLKDDLVSLNLSGREH